MGLLGRVAEAAVTAAAKATAKSAVYHATPTIVKGLDIASAKLGGRNDRKMDNFLERNPENVHLLINQHMFNWSGMYDVYDADREVKYIVKGELLSIKHHLHICDAHDRELGTVKEKLITLRNPLLHEANPVDFILEIDGRKLGKIKSKWAFGKQKYEVDFNNWRIDGNIIGWKYNIYDGNETVAHIEKMYLYGKDTYVIDFPDPQNELLILMLVTALYAANETGKA